MSEGLGLLKKHPRTCQACGVVFEAKKATSRYCSNRCRLATSRFGRSYGQKPPTNMRVWRS